MTVKKQFLKIQIIREKNFYAMLYKKENLLYKDGGR